MYIRTIRNKVLLLNKNKSMRTYIVYISNAIYIYLYIYIIQCVNVEKQYRYTNNFDSDSMYIVVIEFLPASNVIEGMNEYFITPDILSSKLFDLMIHELVMAFFTRQLM